MIALWGLLVGRVFAAEYYLEVAPVTDRAAAAKIEQVVDAAGFDGRVVRRFRLGRGWEFVVLVEHMADPEAAAAAASRLEKDLGAKVSAWKVDGTDKAVAVDLPVATASKTDGPAEWIARARAAHGGDAGGATALARAGAVHFRFSRTFTHGSGDITVRHDYWRESGSRRLAVDTPDGTGQDSLTVVTASGAWIRVGSSVQTRDIGVTLGVVDAFAPEVVLTVAIEAAALLAAPEVEAFKALEGAESGLRFGAGGDESEAGLSFVDIDPATGRLARVRYVTEAGPITYVLEGWKQVSPGVLVPAAVAVERADGRKERFSVEWLELAEHAPAGTFDKPATP